MKIKDYFKNLGMAVKGISIRDAETLLAYFGEYWGMAKTQHTGYVAACLNTMGNYFAKANFRVYKRNADEYIELFDHPFAQLLENPNNFQVENELKHYMGEFFGVFGNYYLLKERGIASKKVRGLTVLDPRQVKPVIGGGGISYYELTIGAQKKRLNREDVIHLKYLSANSQIEGVPLISAIQDVLDIDAFQTAYMKEFYDNGGFLGQVFTTSQNLRPAEFERIKKELKSEYAGKGKSHKLALFTGGLEPIKSAYSLKDMEMTTSRKLTLSEVMTAFRIPQILLGGEGSEYNKATATAAEYSYSSTMIEPALSYIDQVFTKHIRMDYKDNSLVVRHDPVSPKDVDENLKYYEKMAGLGTLTVNDIRKAENYDPFTYRLADVPLINVGGAVVDLSTGEQLGQIPNNADKPVKGADEVKIKSELTDLHWKQAIRRISRELKWFKSQVDEYFDDQRERLIKRLDVKDALIDTFFDSQDELLFLMNLMENGLNRFLERGFEFSGARGLDLISQGIKDQFKNYSQSINETTKKKITDKFNKGELNKESINEIYSNFKDSRSGLIAETTAVAGFNAGLWMGYRAQGYTHKIWVSQKDSEVRHTHAIADGQRVKIDEFFNIGGEQLMYPGDPTASPQEIINCRCVIIGEK